MCEDYPEFFTYGITPGRTLGVLLLEKPGYFSIDLTSIVFIEETRAPLLVIAKNNPDSEGIQSEGGEFLVLAQENQHDIELIMTPGSCPIIE